MLRQVLGYIASNGACVVKDLMADDKSTAAKIVKAFGGKEKANEALLSMAHFLIYHSKAA